MRKRLNHAVLLGALLLLGSCRSNVQPSENNQADSTTVSLRDSGTAKGSIYQADMQFTNQYGDTLNWSSLKGKYRVMTMIFTHCQSACPRIAQKLRDIEKLIHSADSSKVGFVLISFDSKRDTPKELMKFYKDQKLSPRYTLLHGSEDDVQTVAALLDVKFKAEDDGLFSHENVINIISPSGEVLRREEGLYTDNKELADVINEHLH